MDYDKRYMALNPRQKEAVDTIEGPLMVIAGPGTGKTELLSMRVANILKQTDTLPGNILCLTFTESGASTMRTRLTEIIGSDAYKVAVHTFHGFGTEIINRYAEYFYQGSDFCPADELASYEVLRSIFAGLKHDNPLSGLVNGEYIYLKDTLTAISELKKSGLTSDELLQILDANDLALDKIEPMLSSVFSTRITKTVLPQLEPIAKSLASLPPASLPPGITPLGNVLALSLEHTIEAAESDNSTKPITAWKNEWLEKNETGEFIFKDRSRHKKLRALSYVYYQYLTKMQEAKLYDFDDMVLRVVHALEVFPELRYNLQEKYLYIMVDEFQDTNMAQARILGSLANTETGDAPNLMVVGDDDQAIYSFQGAEVGNILDFRERHKDAELVTLTDNYRSTEPILKRARSVITLGENRLERFLPDLDKSLTPNQSNTDSEVQLNSYPHIEAERRAIVESVKQQLKNGVKAADISVIARRHAELVKLLPYFRAANITVDYERRDNVLESDAVVQLTLLARIVHAIATKRLNEADGLLPELLAHPAWGYEPQAIWQLSLAAYTKRTLWLDEMSTRPESTELQLWLQSMATKSLVQPAEALLDQLIGITLDENDDDSFTSPLYNSFFGDTAQPTYVIFLEALRTIRAKLRDYKPNASLKLADFLEFITLHEQLGSGITNVRNMTQDSGSVHLMTAHKSKGLEFDTVYIHGAVDSSWGERVRTRSRLISYPENLPLAPSGDTFDERLRLFFVAMTRAKSKLFISYSLASDNDSATLPASFLVGNNWEPTVHGETISQIDRLVELTTEWYQPLIAIEQSGRQQLLAPYLENYKLSATHLNSFLDVSRGGPEYFLVMNLLRFPQTMSPDAAYGSAIHFALQQAHSHLKSTHQVRPVEDILHDFETRLGQARLSEEQFEQYVQRGTDNLAVFLNETYATFSDQQTTERSFANQQSMVGSAHLTGSLDLMDIDEKSKTIVVTDYKTGKPASSWRGKSDYEKIKLHKYRQQLMFYKLLVEHARDFNSYQVDAGVLQFVEPTSSGRILALELEFDEDELERFKQLVETVWQLITTLDLPDVSGYDKSYSGMLKFESDILSEKE